MTDPAYDYSEKVGTLLNDSLTGLYIHGVFSLFVDKEIQRTTRYGTTFAFALISVDHFSDYNNRHGRIRGIWL